MPTRNLICHTILFPCHHNAIEMLSGITTCVEGPNNHMPKATRVECQYLGQQIDLRESLSRCDLFDLDSNAISETIKNRISNEILPHEHMLIAGDQ